MKKPFDLVGGFYAFLGIFKFKYLGRIIMITKPSFAIIGAGKWVVPWVNF
ncbi:hypothetical protein N752_22715 [Desulforamulus aquiferis]|nr:hypothetical protein [Desulforamulus aquiferis]RYD02830.1 hypothetical protein N752_22715 [Desulforamulus aquiferis]